jgi:GDP-L-fucose synthase
MKKDAKILVTGASGMVGLNLTPLLQKAGYKNLVLVSTKDADLRDTKLVDALFTKHKPEVVIHLAGKVGGIRANMDDPVGFLVDNLQIGINVVEAARRTGVQKLINLASSCVYPRDCKQPMKEEYLLTGIPEPTNEGYALAKIAILRLCQYLHQKEGKNFFTLIPPNMYGVHERLDPQHSHVIVALLGKFGDAKKSGAKDVTLWGDGSARREFLFAEDLARAILFFMENVDAKDIPDTFLNVGPGTDVSIKYLAELIQKIVGFAGKIVWDTSQPNGMPQKLMNTSRLEKLDWKPSTSLEEGLTRAYEAMVSAAK